MSRNGMASTQSGYGGAAPSVGNLSRTSDVAANVGREDGRPDRWEAWMADEDEAYDEVGAVVRIPQGRAAR